MFLLLLLWAAQLSQDVSEVADFLCDTAACAQYGDKQKMLKVLWLFKMLVAKQHSIMSQKSWVFTNTIYIYEPEVLKGKIDPRIDHEGSEGSRSIAVLFL